MFDNVAEECVTKRKELFSEECSEHTVPACDSSRWEAVNQSVTTCILSDNETEECVKTKRMSCFLKNVQNSLIKLAILLVGKQ